ncbi:MAG TPA: MFS transporter [Symbiobacteriaceae bacterium]|nr:MFS transporter [Symbiobacteriaceae bacterium]
MQSAHQTSAPGYKWLVLAVVGFGTFMSALDGSIVNVIVPLVQEQYHATIGSVSWVSTAYLLVICSLLLLVGRLGDMWGFKGVYSIGYALFGAGSLLCGLAPSLAGLVGARVVQGLGAATMMAIGPALITTSFPGNERGRALGMQATLTYLGLTIGPSLGGFVAGQFGWHWVFLINVPVAAVGACLAITLLRPSGTLARQRLDLSGALLVAAGFTATLLSLSRAEVWGWHSVKTLVLLSVGIVLLVLFVWQERRTAQPMLPLALFSSPAFSGGAAAAFLQYATVFMLTFLLPFYLQAFRGLGPKAAGAVMTAQPVVMVSVAALAGWIADKIGARWPATAGMVVIGLGMGLLSRSGADSALPLVMVCLGLVGLGSGLFSAPNNSLIMGAAPRAQQGVAAGLLAAARNVGMVTGIAIANSLFSYLRGATEQGGAAPDAAFLKAFGGTLAVAAAMAAVGALLSLLRPVGPKT